MPTILARVTCPNCHRQFQTPVEQILDVRADPEAKFRLLGGMVNYTVCPHCGMQGQLELPFLYHDPDKELALVYMPMEAGRDDLERQQAIGQLTNAAMESLPPEERKAYLLQPQIFFTYDSLIGRILDADGVTQEALDGQRARLELFQKMLAASDDEALKRLAEENEAIIDEDFLSLLGFAIETARSAGQTDDSQRVLKLHAWLLENTAIGRRIQARHDLLTRLQDNPTRENLLNLLIEAPDEETQELLTVFGHLLMDYLFFQSLTDRIEAAEGEERERLLALRTKILSVRDEVDREAAKLYESRATLLQDLIVTREPEKLARSRIAELDDSFFDVLQTAMTHAATEGDRGVFESLNKIWEMTRGILEDNLPPEIRLITRLLRIQDEEEIERQLQEERELVNEEVLRFLENAENDARRDGRDQLADRLALIRGKIHEMLH